MQRTIGRAKKRHLAHQNKVRSSRVFLKIRRGVAQEISRHTWPWMLVRKKISSFGCIKRVKRVKRVKRGLAKHRSRTALTATEWNKTVPLDLPSALPQNTWRNQPSSFPPSVRSWPCRKNNIDLQRCDFPVILRKSKIKTA